MRYAPGLKIPKLRIFLFQLHCLLGNWSKALLQLQVIAGIDPDTMLLAQIFQPVINCEAFRTGVFQGKLTPLIFRRAIGMGWTSGQSL
jgi:type VI secretion system protein ImpE